MSGLNMRHHHRESVHCEIEGWILLHTVWGTRVLDNEITAAFHPPLLLPCKVWCNTSPSKAAHVQRAANWASSCLSNSDSVNVANLRVTKSHIGIQRKGLCHNYTSLFLILSLPTDIIGVESLYVQLLDGGVKEKLSLLGDGGTSCHTADLRIASGTACQS